MIEKTIISVDEAINIIMDHTSIMGTERVPTQNALNRTLAQNVIGGRHHPPWDNSAMDGYAVQWEDIKNATPNSPTELRVIGEVQAGGMLSRAVGQSEAALIMTGAPVPNGADTVIRIEDTEPNGSLVNILKPCGQGGNIRLEGEDVMKGERVLHSETLIRPAEIGMLATTGHASTLVYQQPKVSVLATGDELTELGEPISPNQIVNSNSYSISALVQESGGIPLLQATAKDTKANLESKVRNAISADIALIIGSVSVGKYDFVKDVLGDLGVDMKFWRVKMRPGHPVAFGVLPRSKYPQDGERLLFGLPGNPVSCMVAFYQFVLPAIRKMTGRQNLFLPRVEAITENDVQNNSNRRHFSRAVTRYENGKYITRLTGNQGSGIISSMVQANSFMIVQEQHGEVKAGDKIQVQLLP
ncbi:MAG: molybdopterin molybdotransferase MoeA [Gammaproteobacteria bacterium]|nr:molybdopterin molybdotransferase MoeA [Gammaproteobacteria bacterium]